MTRRHWLYVGALVFLIVAGALLAGPPREGGSPLTSARPDGFLALARFLHQTGIDVRQTDLPPSPQTTFVLLNDFRDDAAAQSLLRWASRGGRLVVFDPDSAVLLPLRVSDAGPIGGILGTTDLEPRCASPEAVGVRAVVVRVTDSGLTGGGVPATSCYPGGRGAFAVTVDHGSGAVVLLGGSSPLTNEFLDQGDNAAFALAVLGTGRSVAFGPPLPPGRDVEEKGVWTLLPDRAKAAIIGLAAAAVAFALVRGRRLGRPPPESPLSPIPASELVVATGRLYRAARATTHCGRTLREGMANRLKRRMGLPAAAGPEELAAVLGGDVAGEDLKEQLAGPDTETDDELIALGRQLEELRVRVVGSRP